MQKQVSLDTEEFDCENNEIFGTRDYIPPEMLQGLKPTFGSDLWSLGIIIWQLYSLDNSTPFEASSEEETFKLILNGDYSMPEGPHVTSEVKDLIRRLLVLNQDSRLGAQNFEELMRHPYFKDQDFTSLYLRQPPLPARVLKLTKQKENEKAFLPSSQLTAASQKTPQSPNNTRVCLSFADMVKTQ